MIEMIGIYLITNANKIKEGDILEFSKSNWQERHNHYMAELESKIEKYNNDHLYFKPLFTQSGFKYFKNILALDVIQHFDKDNYENLKSRPVFEIDRIIGEVNNNVKLVIVRKPRWSKIYYYKK